MSQFALAVTNSKNKNTESWFVFGIWSLADAPKKQTNEDKKFTSLTDRI